jgi:hypothetical protein
MRFRTILTLAILFLTCLTVAVWSAPPSAQPAGRPHHSATQKATVTGKISSVGDGSFAVDVKNSEDVVTIKFLIDDSTKFDGRLEVGAVATVDYRTEDVHNIAIRVIVKPAAHSD